jgi:hypothetical protein
MRYSIIIVAITWLLAACANPAHGVVEVVNHATNETCKGVVVAPNVVATASHCIKRASASQVSFDGRRGAEILARGRTITQRRAPIHLAQHDWALIRVPALPAAPIPVRVKDLTGIIITYDHVREGQSGGPLIENGAVIGLFVGYQGNQAIAVSASQFAGALP